MSLTEHDTGYFAHLWLKESDAQVLVADDAALVARRAIRTGEGRATPCARELPAPLFDRKTNREQRRSFAARAAHSSWVH